MPLYDFLAPAYDLAFEKIYLPFRTRALENLGLKPGATVLDLACGTGQNFPLLARQIGPRGHLIGLDLSGGMLRRAQRRAAAAGIRATLLRANAAELTPALLQTEAGLPQVDAVLCTYGFTSMTNPGDAFRASWNLLKPGGIYLILDIHAAGPSLHTRAFELATFTRIHEKTWRSLEAAAADFRMDYLDPSAHLFGGRLFIARGTKGFAPTH